MRTFCEFFSDVALSRLRLIETYFSFDPAEYNRLFDDELGKLPPRPPSIVMPWNECETLTGSG